MSHGPQRRDYRSQVSERSSQGLGWVRGSMARAGLSRPAHGGLVGGVLAGLARRLGISPWAARALFVVSFILPGPQLIAYPVLWLLMPRAP